MHRDKPVLSLTKVSSVSDDAEMHAGAYDFCVITGGTGSIIVGGKIANMQPALDRLPAVFSGDQRRFVSLGADSLTRDYLETGQRPAGADSGLFSSARASSFRMASRASLGGPI